MLHHGPGSVVSHVTAYMCLEYIRKNTKMNKFIRKAGSVLACELGGAGGKIERIMDISKHPPPCHTGQTVLEVLVP